MNEEQLQAYLDKEYPDLDLEVNTERGPRMDLVAMGHIGFHANLASDESIDHIKVRLLSSLGDVKRLVEDSIEKVRINLGMAVVICGQQAVRVDDGYWIDAFGMEKLMDRVTTTPYCGTIFYNSVPVTYKPILDAQGEK